MYSKILIQIMALLLTLLASSNSQAANSCGCIFEQGTKQLLQQTDHWWGSSMRFTCEYNCKVKGEINTEVSTKISKVTGNHSIWFMGDEEGNEYVCEGTLYEQRFSPASNWFYYDYVGSRYFNPTKSQSPLLRKWAVENNCK